MASSAIPKANQIRVISAPTPTQPNVSTVLFTEQGLQDNYGIVGYCVDNVAGSYHWVANEVVSQLDIQGDNLNCVTMANISGRTIYVYLMHK